MKTRKERREPHPVPLSRQSLDLLAALKAQRTGPYVFFGQNTHQPCTRQGVLRACYRVTEGTGSPHGWRATFGSWCADTGVPREVAEAALAHTLGGVEAANKRAAMVERRRPVMQAWADHCDGNAPNENAVVAFGKRA
jgi:integrase